MCPACFRALPAPLGGVSLRYGDCDDVVAAYAYDYPVDVMVKHLKYGRGLDLAKPLARGLVYQLRDALRPDACLAMPLSERRWRERGYNQAREIAVPLARWLSLPLISPVVRVRHTSAQASLGHAARQENVAGAFQCRMPLQGRHVAVVDDVMTTGATLREVARALRSQGARKVSAWVVAHTPLQEW